MATGSKETTIGPLSLRVNLPQGRLRTVAKRAKSALRGTSARGTATIVPMPPVEPKPLTAEARKLQEQADGMDWYHVLQLPDGVVTRGRVDLRPDLPNYQLPADMTGMRALDVATFDGYFAFEMERRGADVVAIDLPSFGEIDLPMRWKERMDPADDVPTGAGFKLAHKALGSKVERKTISVYDLSPENVGSFDYVVLSDLLQHLRDPQKALESVYTVVKPGGVFLLAEVYEPAIDNFGDEALVVLKTYQGRAWAHPSVAALRLMLQIAGFQDIEEISRPYLKYGGAYDSVKVILRSKRPV